MCFLNMNIHEFDSGSERMLSVCLTHASCMFVFMIFNIAYGCKKYKYFTLKFDNIQSFELISNIKKRK